MDPSARIVIPGYLITSSDEATEVISFFSFINMKKNKEIGIVSPIIFNYFKLCESGGG